MVKKILLITTGQPSTNPRIVKEADALHKAGYDVTVLYCYFIAWALQTDKELLKQVKWQYQIVGGSPKVNIIMYFFTRVKFKIATILNKYIGNKFLLAEHAQCRAYDELLSKAKKIKADWYIGHNLGALSIAVKAAIFNEAKAGFDFEDFHQGEYFPDQVSSISRIKFLENKYLHFLNYISAASDLISKFVIQQHPYFTGKVIALLNCFPKSQQPVFIEKHTETQLQLCWFSQTIGPNRGLELVIEALNLLCDNSIHLTLVGRLDSVFKNYIHLNAPKLLPNIHFAGIIQPERLPIFLAGFDVGLATELNTPSNRDYCLTNKIFTYLLAGNAIIMSDTSMQQIFNNQYNIGWVYSHNEVTELAKTILRCNDRYELMKQRKKNYNLANTILNWEAESAKFLEILA